MKILRRLLYLLYYVRTTQWGRYLKFLKFAAAVTGQYEAVLFFDSVLSVFKYNVSLLEYFQFGFYEKTCAERAEWAGTGFMYEYQLLMNPRSSRTVLADKRLFYEYYRSFFKHKVYTIEELRSNARLRRELLRNKSGKIVFKDSHGRCGAHVRVCRVSEFARQSILSFMERNGYDMAEEFVQQHDRMDRLSPSGLNTVRIVTQLDANNNTEILGCRLRISVDSPVDNLAAGNLAAPIDEATGVVSGNAVYSDITRAECEFHPITKVRIRGFQIPFWQDTLKFVKDLAAAHKGNRSVGWDIAITPDGPDIIEGNHDWCKLLWQMPVKKGMKRILRKHMG